MGSVKNQQGVSKSTVIPEKPPFVQEIAEASKLMVRAFVFRLHLRKRFGVALYSNEAPLVVDGVARVLPGRIRNLYKDVDCQGSEYAASG
jgi:hypothetical protein